MELQLDKDFKATSKTSISFDKFTFNGGEPHIKLGNLAWGSIISHRINSFNDFGELLVAIDASYRSGCSHLNAIIPYFPGARQDRVMVEGEPLTVKVYADILNSYNLNSVTIFDPHSDVTPALLNNCKVVSNHRFINNVLLCCENQMDYVNIVSPDGGALKKVYELSKYLSPHFDVNIVECSKKRYVTTGQLSGFKIYEDDLQGGDCLIVDDICDGGGTFVGLAKELKAKGVGDIYLAVSHGIFSKGFSELDKYFKRIFTTDSFKGQRGSKVTELKLCDGLLS